MLFLISSVFSVIGMFFSFFGITHENFTNHPQRIKRLKISLAFCFGLALLFAYLENREGEIRNDKQYNTIVQLKTIDSTSAVQIKELSAENKRANREYVDSIVNYHNYTTELLASYGIKVDTLSHTVQRFDNAILKETPPTLRVTEYPEFTTMYDPPQNAVDYYLEALNADVHLMEYSYVFINVHPFKNGEGDSLSVPQIGNGTSLNYTTIIAAGETIGRTIFIDRGRTLTDMFVLVLEFYYKSKGGKVQVPVRKIYVVTKSSKKVQEAGNDLHFRVSQHLKEHKIWTKFYDL